MRKMGVPITMVCAVTENDIVARTLRDGDFSMAPSVKQTLATAMDIQVRTRRNILLFSDTTMRTVSVLEIK